VLRSLDPPPTDLTSQHPRSVEQMIRHHFERYTPEMMERVTGCPKSIFLRVYEALTKNSGRKRTGAFCYAVGRTHNVHSVQIIRPASTIEDLVGTWRQGREGNAVTCHYIR
jgi:formate dehydrogenase major subunit